MKNSQLQKTLLYPFLVLALVSLACGSSTPQVNLPGEESNQPTVAPPPSTPTEAPKPLGSARSNPAPLGAEVIIDDMAMKITEIISPANDIVMSGNQFNTIPDPGNVYIFVSISITCNKSADSNCNIGGYEFSLIDSTGISHNAEIFIAGVSGLLASGEFYGGATKAGYLAFIVPEGDTGLILKYDSFLSEAFFALQ